MVENKCFTSAIAPVKEWSRVPGECPFHLRRNYLQLYFITYDPIPYNKFTVADYIIYDSSCAFTE